MSDDLPTVWAAEPHTLAKHAILRNYLQAWSVIMARQVQNRPPERAVVRFIDGFAGPGEYSTGESGSPVVALRTVLDHSQDFPVPVRFFFIEGRADRHAHLCGVLDRLAAEIQATPKVQLLKPRLGECAAILNEALDVFEQRSLTVGPALFFLDQFGYSQVPMSLIARVMRQRECEVFSYLNFAHLNHYLADATKWPAFNVAFGGDEWRPALALSGRARHDFLIRTYKQVLKERGNAKHVWPFAIFNASGALLHWLVFCTNSLRGLEEMKKAMWKVDSTGTFRFSDRDDPRQTNFLSDMNDDWLPDALANALDGRTLTRDEIWTHVLTETPFYLYKSALKRLEDDGRLRVSAMPARRRKGSFPDSCNWSITFRSTVTV